MLSNSFLGSIHTCAVRSLKSGVKHTQRTQAPRPETIVAIERARGSPGSAAEEKLFLSVSCS